jgi:cytochrome c oxidase assembly protein subunit 15
VTTYDAGMAVPDWPGTYGYNLFLYPWQTWIAGPWDLLIEHGHRLLGALSGMLTIALVLAVFRWDRRTWMRYFSLGALVAVILQGLLGGLRVLLDDRSLAMIHGCAGPAFLAVCVILCVVSSRTWKQATAIREATRSEPGPVRTGLALHLTKVPELTAAIAAAAYIQLVIGALMRHIPVTASPNFFRWTVFAHLFVAGLVASLVIAVVWLVFRGRNRWTGIRLLVSTMLVLVGCQLILGCATWIVNYYWPGWVPDWSVTARYDVIEAKGWVQAMVVTAHQAMGSLIVGVSVWLMLLAYRPTLAESEVRTAGVNLTGCVGI